ncbi:MAG: hypothetical protein ABIT58_04705 [Ferruginibacter sp.]
MNQNVNGGAGDFFNDYFLRVSGYVRPRTILGFDRNQNCKIANWVEAKDSACNAQKPV